MTYEEFQEYVRAKCMYETIYTDSDGREILVIKLLDAYGMVNRAKPDGPAKVSPLEFVTMVLEKEHLVGRPIAWAEWPNEENT